MVYVARSQPFHLALSVRSQAYKHHLGGRFFSNLSLQCLLPFSLQGYDDGYGGEYDDESYEIYDDSYNSQAKRYRQCTHTHTQLPYKRRKN